ncbi:MAG: DUF3883 domain-containing protein, partial [Actinomycetota bacterium]|nr:DUF3883 domain-containing protein [Actinomycetota bacterium]
SREAPYRFDVELQTNRQIEDAAIAHVLSLEAAAGRAAIDTRGKGCLADIEGDRLIEVKAYGRSARGWDLWLETGQVRAAEADPARFHLIIVDNVRQGDPAAFGVLDISGDQLVALLERKREKHYYEVPLPVAVYDRLLEQPH